MARKVGLSNHVLLWSLLLVFSLALLSHGAMDEDPSSVVEHHMHIKEAIIETFEINGDIIDCIDINKQPAFKHPLLINHTLQVKPTHYPDKRIINDYPMESSHPWNLSKSCPERSIPIRRIKRNGHFRDDPFTSHQYLNPHYSFWQRGMGIQRDDPNTHEYAAVEVYGGKYYGAKTFINVWNPKVETSSEFSVSQIWVTSRDKKISLEAGWGVHPTLYGDARTRFFTLWTTNGYQTYCFNLRCPGFVHTNQHTTLDTYLQPMSVYGGPQHGIEVEIFKDRNTGNWWLRLIGADMGYWPKELVPYFADGADSLFFGGEVVNHRSTGEHTGTQMGSGHFSSEGFQKASFFKNVQVLDTSYTHKNPPRSRQLVSRPTCYDLQVGSKRNGTGGYYFFYGGPGRSQQCT